MTYTKPEVAVLGNAVEMILQQQKPNTSGGDPTANHYAFVPAYDLDE
jgi:hypothetical protein